MSDSDAIKRVQGQTDEVVDIMQDNIQKVTRNMDNLEELEDKTDALNQNAANFKKGATELKRVMWWKNLKIQLAIGGVFLIIVLIIVISIVASTGGSSSSSSSS